ncbi:MAG: (d)CMP kinase [Bdellovibrionales bacterium]
MAKTTRTFVVTIDGPSASGKSSVSRELARRHGWKWVSTGAFYRGLAVVARARKVALNDEAALVALAESDVWEVRLDPNLTMVLLNGQDVTEQIYREETGADASIISQIPKVRQSLLEAQRNCAVGVKGLVAEGRDCGTVVFPDAQVKIYLTAHSENRIERRAREEGKSKDNLRAAQTKRDHQDSTRKSAPLQVPENAHVVDTSDLDLPSVIDTVDALVKEAMRS